MTAFFFTKAATQFPVFEIRRMVEQDLITRSHCEYPLFGSCVPNNFWITEIFDTRIFDHGVVGVFGPGSAFIRTIGNTLCLKIFSACFFSRHIMVSEDGHQRRFCSLFKTGGIFFIHHHTSRENISMCIRIQSNGLVLPMYHVFTDGMAPVHRSPYRTVGIVLVKQMILAFVVHHTIGIVHPFGGRRKMKLWAVRLLVNRFLSDGGMATQ